MGYLIPLIGRSAPEQNVGGGYNKPAPAHSDAPINGFALNYLDSVSTRGSAPARTNLLPKGRTFLLISSVAPARRDGPLCR